MNDQNLQEIWQVDVNGEIYETDFEGLANWIAEGSLLANDKVRRGNLRWLEAGKIPLLHSFFNAKELGISPPVLTTMPKPAVELETAAQIEAENFTLSPKILHYNLPEQITESEAENLQNTAAISDDLKPSKKNKICAVHPEVSAFYSCGGCAELFCKACPATYDSVKICPFCGAMCKSLAETVQKQKQLHQFETAAAASFGFADCAKSLAYPFKFKASLIFGAIFFTIFWLGQSVWIFGGFMLVSAIFCAMLANTLTFGVLANTVENFAQGKITSDFMPRFDDFSAWDDVIHPFLLSIGVYIISFGLLFALIVGATWYAVSSLTEIDKGKDKIISSVLPVPPDDLSLVKQSAQVRQLTEQIKKQNKFKDGNMPNENAIIQSQSGNSNEAAIFENLQNQIKQAQTEPQEAAANNNLSEMPENVMRLSLIFSIPIFLAFLWGVFYFPAACAVAAYTRSFKATLNPLIGFDTIKRLGFDYAKILGVSLILGVFAIVLNSILGTVFAPLDLPQIGNLAVKVFDGVLYFYFSIVFSVVLGFVIYKNSRNLNFS